MNLVRNCPDCESVFRGNECSCGWKISSSNSSPYDDKCSYSFEGRRCPLYGTMSSNSAWYCSGHLAALGDFHDGKAALKFAEENYSEIMHERKCKNDLLIHMTCERCKAWDENKKEKMAKSKKHTNSEKQIPKPVGESYNTPRRLGTTMLPIVQPRQNLAYYESFKGYDSR